MANLTAAKTTAGRGSIGGASGDAGVEYRRGVAAFAVACGLTGYPLPGFSVADADAQVQAVVLETEEALDDIRIEFKSGCQALVQAKRTLSKGSSFEKAVAQWVDAAKGYLDPSRDRLVIVAGELKGAVRSLARILERSKTGIHATPTKEEAEALDYLKGLLGALTVDQRELLFKCAVILELKVEEDAEQHSLLAIHYLTRIVTNQNPDEAKAAWLALRAEAGRLARQRSGHYLEGWQDVLRASGIDVSHEGSSPSADLERLNRAIGHYKKKLVDDGTFISLHGLAAGLPAIPIEEVDAEVLVAIPGESKEIGQGLLWAFLRRGRIILTGLPGSGKSTAVRLLAAQLAELPGGPLPVCVALRDVEALPRTESFRERVLSVAVRDLPGAYKQLVRQELDRRFCDGGAAILFDSLDETHDKRHAVARQVCELMSEVSEDVDALLSTREVAYSSAATLGWPHLPLLAPNNIEQTIETILKYKAALRMPESVSTDAIEWINERRGWVKSALRDDSTLSETPLIPVLLTLLAAEKNIEGLPRGRARVLHTVVQNVLDRYEVRKLEEQTIGSLNGTQVAKGIWRAFCCEASTILDHNGCAEQSVVQSSIALDLEEYWGLGSGQADSTAQDIVWFLDESGIFVISGENETIAPRIALLAEIGDAVGTTQLAPNHIEEWVKRRLQNDQVEPVVLAASLQPQVAKQLFARAAESGERHLLNAAVQARQDGATMSDAELRHICQALITDFQAGTSDAWESLAQLLRLPVPNDMQSNIEEASTAYDESRVKLVRAQLQLHFHTSPYHEQNPHSLLDVLAITDLPAIQGAKVDKPFDLMQLLAMKPLEAVQMGAARALLGKVPQATALVMQRAREGGSRGMLRDLRQALMDAGLNAEAQELPDEKLSPTPPAIFSRILDCDYRSFLQLIADRPSTELSHQQRFRLTELADFLDTLAMNDPGGLHLLENPELTMPVIGLIESLFGFDSRIIAAQAAITVQRIDACSSNDAYTALFDLATARKDFDWDAVADANAAVAILGNLLTLGPGHRRLASRILLEVPTDLSIPLLRDVLPKLASPDSQHLVASMLTVLGNGPEPELWLDDPNPVLRSVAAQYFEPAANDSLSPQHHKLLTDPDGHVRFAALNRAKQLNPPDMGKILDTFRRQPEAGWMCLACRTINAPGSKSCNRPDRRCFGSTPPRPKDA